MQPIATLTAAIAVAGLVGCTSTTPDWDAQFGETTRGLMASQIIDPDASFNPDPVVGIDGKAARAAMTEYHSVHTQPQVDAGFFTIDVGGMGR